MNVAIIDKLPVFLTGVRVTIDGSFGKVMTFETARIQSLRNDLAQQVLDFIIIGISEEQPDRDRRALKTAMKNNPNASVIVYANKPGHEMVSSLVRMGAKGVLSKNSCPRDLIDCIQSVMAEEPYLCTLSWSAAPDKSRDVSD